MTINISPSSSSREGTSRIALLHAKEQRGSRIRCLLLTDGSSGLVAERLTALASPFARIESARHFWMPRGISEPEEAKLGQSRNFLTNEQKKNVTDWWLRVPERANTPNWDIASTAEIDGRKGLLLVEAKAHKWELSSQGKPKGASANSHDNHQQIAEAIREANQALTRATGLDWEISRDSHYQLANRFAWAWKLASLRIPVVLVYLRFTEAHEMPQPLTGDDWENLVRSHAWSIVPDAVWERPIYVGDTPIRALIRRLRIDIPSMQKL